MRRKKKSEAKQKQRSEGNNAKIREKIFFSKAE
jgi:hypothetical protein